MTSNMASVSPAKIVVVGNIAGGKTRLSRSLALQYNLPLIHVDSVQFLPGLKLRPWPETKALLLEAEKQDRWLIDGYGPLDIIESRFQKADVVVFIDFPLWRHRWWFIKRQFFNIFSRRPELPAGGHELSWAHTQKLWRSMQSSHRQMRPELLRIFARENLKNKVIYVRNWAQYRDIKKNGLPR